MSRDFIPIPKPVQCECCASQLAETIELDGTKRDICNNCLGFMARWLIELEGKKEEQAADQTARALAATIKEGK